MASSLLQNLSSAYIEASSKLQPKNAPQKVLMYVESYDDVAFWHFVTTQINKKNIHFDIQTPSINGLEKGKKAVLKHRQIQADANQLGKGIIYCVDSDFDFLLDNRTPTSLILNTCEFTFQTYTYSIENYKCFAPNLKNHCVKATKKTFDNPDLEEIVIRYSNIIYHYFVFVFYINHILKKNIHHSKHNFNTFNINEIDSEFEILQQKYFNSIKELDEFTDMNFDDIEKLKIEFEDKGLTCDNVYLFIQGHQLVDGFILPLLNTIYKNLIKHENKNIINSNVSNSTKTNSLNFYKNINTPISIILNEDTSFSNCFLFNKIIDDFNNYLLKF